MGLACSKKRGAAEEDGGGGPTIVRLSPFRPPFRPRRCASLSRRLSLSGGAEGPSPSAVPSLLSLAADAAVASLHRLPPASLAALPTDLCQLLLDRLASAGLLDDAAISRLSRLGLHFYRLPLAGYHEVTKPAWLRCLASGSLEAALLSQTGVTDGALACLGCPPRLHTLHLDLCVDITDAGLALLQGLSSLQDLSLRGCEQLTPLGLRSLGGLTRIARLNLQACHAIGELSSLSRLSLLQCLDLGWCSGVGDADAEVVAGFVLLTELNLARTKITDTGLAHLCTLRGLRAINLAGLQVSDEALAGLLCQLGALRTLCLDRCHLAGDRSAEALGKHARQLRELALGYTAVTNRGLAHLTGLQQLRALSLENCSVGDPGLLDLLPSLAALQRLDLSDTGAGNGCMPALGQLRELESLNLSFTGVTDWGLKRLTRLPKLRCLNLDSRLFTDQGMPSVAKISTLESLDLFGARVGDAGCAALSKLRNLKRLEVCGGHVTDAGAASLAALPRLEHLSLAQNYRMGNACISHLLRLNELTALNLSQTRVTSHSVVALGCLPQLQTLALHETRVQPFAVDKLLSANPGLVVQGVSPSRR